MSNISQVNLYTKIKQATDSDSRNFGPLVQSYEAQTSTASQSIINITQFVCDLSQKTSVQLFIDGQLLTEGVGNDYVWNAGVNNTSTQIQLAAAIPVGLNILIYKLGATRSLSPNAETLQANINGMVPSGAMMEWAGPSDPSTGWFICDGRAVSRSTFSSLFAALGVTHGTGNGSTTFNIPDKRFVSSRGTGTITTLTGTGTVVSNNATFTVHNVNRTGFRVRLQSGTLTGLTTVTNYFAIVVDSNTLAFATTHANAIAGTKIAISGANSAVITQWEDPDASTRLQAAVGGNALGVGSRQDDQNLGHKHGYVAARGTAGQAADYTGFHNPTNFSPSPNTSGSPAVSGLTIVAHDGIQTSGGNQSNNRNIATNYIIKY